MFETGDFQTPAPPESGIAGNAVASTPQDHWLYNELVDGFHIDRVVRDYNYSMDIRHIHEEYEIYYLLEGERYYFVNQQTYLVTAGTLVFIDKEQIHRTGMASAGPHHDRIVLGIMEEPFSTFLASFGGLQLQSFFTEQGSILTLPEEMRPYIQSLLQDIASELIHKKPGYLLAAMTKLAEFFIAVLRLQPEGPVVSSPARHSNPKYQKVDEVAHYIVGHCTERISLEDLAGRFYINKFYLSRITFIPPEEQYRHENFCEPIIDIATWNRAQFLLEQRSKINPRSKNGRRLHRYAGLIKCADCGLDSQPADENGVGTNTLNTPAAAIIATASNIALRIQSEKVSLTNLWKTK